jgi:small subunit ribosomal protein S5
MRFAALVVAGDKAGKVGFGFKKGLDYQDAVKKATKQASNNLLKVSLSDQKSIAFPTTMKFKAARIFLKPAFTGTGLIAGGYIRPVLELAGIENIYSKIIGSRNKVTGVQAMFEALKKYSA